jgi:hypothetical protein
MLCGVVCVFSWLSLLEIGFPWLRVFDMAFVVCGLMTLISFMSTIRRLRGGGFESSAPGLTDGNALWESYDIVARAQRFDGVYLIPGFEISRNVLASSSVAYMVTFICVISIRLGLLRILH